MSVTSGSPTQIHTAVATSAEVSALDDTAMSSGDMASTSTGGLKMWLLDEASVVALSASVLATKSGQGRWIQQVVAPAGGGNFTYSVATLADRPAPGTVPDGTWVFVQSQKSWYWTDLAANTWRRLVVPNEAWMTQTAWGIDTATGNDENVGSVASPLRTVGEIQARLPTVNRTTTVTLAAGSTFGANDWASWAPFGISGAQATIPTVTITGTRSLGANLVVASSSDEAGNAAPLIDAGVGLIVNKLIQATSGAQNGATAAVLLNIAGNQYRTTPWRSSGGARVAPPGAGDTIAIVTNISIPVLGTSSPNMFLFWNNVGFVSFGLTTGLRQLFAACEIPTIALFGFVSYVFNGCAMLGTQFANGRVSINLCSLTGLTTVAGTAVGISILNSVYQGAASIVCDAGSYIDSTSLGVFGTAGQALQILRRGMWRARGTLYGSGNTGVGTLVYHGGYMVIDAANLPTLSSVGQELVLEAGATAIPPLVAGLVVPAAVPLATWADWNGGGRHFVNYSTGATIDSV